MTLYWTVARGLAQAFLAGDWKRAQWVRRGQEALGDSPPWLPKLCTRVWKDVAGRPVELYELETIIAHRLSAIRLRVLSSPAERFRVPPIRRWFFDTPRMLRPWSADLGLPQLESEGALAAFLGVDPSALDWFADVTRRNAAGVDARLRHYHYRWVPKRSQGHRLLETPKPRLAALQRKIAQNVLARMPPSAAAHGFVPARSFRLDRRLAGLARVCGAQFTRYADDLAFSGGRDFERRLSRFITRVGAIVLEEGFRVRYRKTRVLRSGKRQALAGLVLNRRINVPRDVFDALRAELYNAGRFGSGVAEPHAPPRVPRASARTHRVDRRDTPRARGASAQAAREHRLGGLRRSRACGQLSAQGAPVVRVSPSTFSPARKRCKSGAISSSRIGPSQ